MTNEDLLKQVHMVHQHVNNTPQELEQYEQTYAKSLTIQLAHSANECFNNNTSLVAVETTTQPQLDASETTMQLEKQQQ